jgi:tRNA(fMet)-specific endonuclease VapC
MRYLLDTNVLSALMREPAGIVTERIRAVGEKAICTSIVVIAEIRYGIEKVRSRRLAAQLDSILPGISVLPFAQPADQHYAAIRAATEHTGITVSQNDLLIAAQTRALGAALVTDDAIFSRVPGLKVENWLRS